MKGILIFLVVFGLLVFVHEFGHFIVAKKSGILVREFSIGMGPKLFQIRRNPTTYTIRWLPLGGYVRLAGSDDESKLDPGLRIWFVWRNVCNDTKFLNSVSLLKNSTNKFIKQRF